MRRPSPLPQAPSAPRADDAPADPDAATPAPRTPTTAAPQAEAEASLAPVVALTGQRMPRPAPLATPPAGPGSPSDPVPADDLDAPVAPEQEIRLRDVWKAARASRRALRSEVRRFTGRHRRRRLTWMLSLAAIVLLVVGSVGAAYSPLFAVERVRVVGVEALDATAVEAALAGQLGTPLPLVDESAVKAALVGFPLVESYALEARPPHELVVRIVERTPVGVIEGPAGFSLVDAAGVVLSTSESPLPGHPVLTVEGGTGSPAFTALGHVIRALPDEIRAQVTAGSATTPDDVTLRLGGTNTDVVWGSADQSARKAEVLQKMMVQRPPASVSTYDVSSPSAIVVR